MRASMSVLILLILGALLTPTISKGGHRRHVWISALEDAPKIEVDTSSESSRPIVKVPEDQQFPASHIRTSWATHNPSQESQLPSSGSSNNPTMAVATEFVQTGSNQVANLSSSHFRRSRGPQSRQNDPSSSVQSSQTSTELNKIGNDQLRVQETDVERYQPTTTQASNSAVTSGNSS